MTQPWNLPGYQRLLNLQQRIYAHGQAVAVEDELDHTDPAHPLWWSDIDHLVVAPMRAGAHVGCYFSNIWEEPWAWTQQTLSEPAVSSMITALVFDGPDQGANGTRDWTFTPLLDSDARFPLLRALFIKPTAPDDHNISLIQRAGAIMKEGGEIARFVAKAPYLTELTVPNAPDASFFAAPTPHLMNLRIGSGYDTQNFIRNLAASDNLPALTRLDFSESAELRLAWQAHRRPDQVTAFEDYATLLRSPSGQRLSSLCLRNTSLSLAELEALQALHPRLQFMVIQDSAGGYVSHFRQDVFPWRHLIQPDSGTDDMRYAMAAAGGNRQSGKSSQES